MLPAVQTPAGQPNGWSRVSGLVNAFVHAGARNVVLSLWRGPEATRQELVLAFYRELEQGRCVPEALRQARQAVRARHPEPRHWAGWVCAGELG
jgi:CHAT domain-containing protein